jgi:hypothetical protein
LKAKRQLLSEKLSAGETKPRGLELERKLDLERQQR